MYFSCSLGKVTDTIAYEVVWIDHDDQPCRNLNKKAKIVNVIIEGANGVSPKPIIDNPIVHNPATKINLLPTLVIILPTIGDPKMTATEYIQKM